MQCNRKVGNQIERVRDFFDRPSFPGSDGWRDIGPGPLTRDAGTHGRMAARTGVPDNDKQKMSAGSSDVVAMISCTRRIVTSESSLEWLRKSRLPDHSLSRRSRGSWDNGGAPTLMVLLSPAMRVL